MSSSSASCSGDKEYVCGRCGFKAAREANLISHLQRKYPCPAEIRDVSLLELLEEHRSEKTAGWDLQCTVCKAPFKNKFALYRHRKNKCPGNAPKPVDEPNEITEAPACPDDGYFAEIETMRNDIKDMRHMIETRLAIVEARQEQILQQLACSGMEATTTVVDEKPPAMETTPVIPWHRPRWVGYLNDSDIMYRCFFNRDIVSYVKHIYFNEYHPENACVRMNDKGALCVLLPNEKDESKSEWREVRSEERLAWRMVSFAADELRRHGENTKTRKKIDGMAHHYAPSLSPVKNVMFYKAVKNDAGMDGVSKAFVEDVLDVMNESQMTISTALKS